METNSKSNLAYQAESNKVDSADKPPDDENFNDVDRPSTGTLLKSPIKVSAFESAKTDRQTNRRYFGEKFERGFKTKDIPYKKPIKIDNIFDQPSCTNETTEFVLEHHTTLPMNQTNADTTIATEEVGTPDKAAVYEQGDAEVEIIRLAGLELAW